MATTEDRLAHLIAISWLGKRVHVIDDVTDRRGYIIQEYEGGMFVVTDPRVWFGRTDFHPSEPSLDEIPLSKLHNTWICPTRIMTMDMFLAGVQPDFAPGSRVRWRDSSGVGGLDSIELTGTVVRTPREHGRIPITPDGAPTRIVMQKKPSELRRIL